jgi:hypothetical protein
VLYGRAEVIITCARPKVELPGRPPSATKLKKRHTPPVRQSAPLYRARVSRRRGSRRRTAARAAARPAEAAAPASLFFWKTSLFSQKKQ